MLLVVQLVEPVPVASVRVLAAGGPAASVVTKSIPGGVLVMVGGTVTVYVTLMILGLPATSVPEQVSVEHPLTVMEPVKVPDPKNGARGVMVISPVEGPVI